MAKSTREQFDMLSTGTDAFVKLSELALSGCERLTALNLKMARTALEDGVTASRSLARAKGVEDMKDLPNPMAEDLTEKAVAYLRDVQEITTDMQQDLIKVMTAQFSTLSKGSAGTIPGLDVFNKLAQQTSDMAQANLKSAAETTEKVAASVAPPHKKSA